MYICMCVCVCVYVCACMYLCMYVCMIYIYIVVWGGGGSGHASIESSPCSNTRKKKLAAEREHSSRCVYVCIYMYVCVYI